MARLQEETQLKSEALKSAADRLRSLESQAAEERNARESAEGHADRVSAELAELQVRTMRGESVLPVAFQLLRLMRVFSAPLRRRLIVSVRRHARSPPATFAAGEVQGTVEESEAGDGRGGEGRGACPRNHGENETEASPFRSLSCRTCRPSLFAEPRRC